ncbi:MAG: flagellar basal body-associated FliL family protein [Halothiobacillaceae bacterium]
MAEAEEEGKKKGSKLVLILLIVVILLVLALGAVGAMMFLGGDKEAENGEGAETEQVEEQPAEAAKGPAVNFELGEAITVNFANPTDARLLQMNMQFRTHLENGEAFFTKHKGEIVNNINLVASEFDPATLRTREGKEQLRDAIAVEVNQVIENREGVSDAVDDVFLTRILMQ